MHPRRHAPGAGHARRARARLLDFVRERGVVHPREVDAHFAHGTVTNYWGGSSSATTHLLDDALPRLLRVARRDGGIRIYAVREPRHSQTPPTPRARGRAGRRRRRACTRRCRRAACLHGVGGCATPRRSGAASSSAALRARESGWRTRASTASTGTGRPARRPARGAG